MLRTPLCELLGIEVPVIQGPLGGPWEQSMDLPAAVCGAGGLGSVLSAMSEGRAHELIPLTGQTAGMITEVLPAAEIVRRIVADAEAALRAVHPLLG